MTVEPNILLEILRDVGIPALTLVGGWFAHMFRTKQKKEADVLDNVQQILKLQKDYIAEQDAENKKTRDMNARLERKLDEKRESIRKANKCKFTTEGDGCPVLNHEDYLDEKCKNCDLKNHAEGEN
jgi:septal ring factor EnvC (AmiA/AmiB activator)